MEYKAGYSLISDSKLIPYLFKHSFIFYLFILFVRLFIIKLNLRILAASLLKSKIFKERREYCEAQTSTSALSSQAKRELKINSENIFNIFKECLFPLHTNVN